MSAEVKQESGAKRDVAKFTKAQILASVRYSNRKDVLGVLLDEQTSYTFDDVDKLLDKFMKGTVK